MIFFEPHFFIGLLIAAAVMWLFVPENYRSKFIISASAIGLLSVQPFFTVFLFGLVVTTYFLALGITRIDEQSQKIRTFLLGVGLLTFVLFAGKYAGGFFRELFENEAIFARLYLVPLGISYLIFKLVAFLLDVYRGVIKEPSLEELLAFILFIPSFPAGPIERYQNFAHKRQKKMDAAFLLEGLRRLALGFFKKVVIVNFLLHEIVTRRLQPRILENDVSLDLSASLIITYLVGALIYGYLDHSSYADIAIGFGRLFGYELMENMNYPIFQSNLADYWARWHISLSSWCRSNVYFPVLASSRNNVLALYASFVVMGLWHNISLNWLLWGLWHASGLTIYSKWQKFKRKHKKKLKGKVPKYVGYPLGTGLTILYSSLGFSFIMLDSSKDMINSTLKSLRLLAAIVV